MCCVISRTNIMPEVRFWNFVDHIGIVIDPKDKDKPFIFFIKALDLSCNRRILGSFFQFCLWFTANWMQFDPNVCNKCNELLFLMLKGDYHKNDVTQHYEIRLWTSCKQIFQSNNFLTNSFSLLETEKFFCLLSYIICHPNHFYQYTPI